MSRSIDLRRITACGECCDGCPKLADGRCGGCIASDGLCEEWQGSGGCPIHRCAGEHGVTFCGLCGAFPCSRLPEWIHWRKDAVAEIAALARRIRAQEHTEA